MRREVFTLATLGERYARFARSMNRSEKTIAWYQGALADYCRYLEGPGGVDGVDGPARLEDLTLERVRDYILYLRERPTFEAHPFRASRKAGLSDASVNSYARALRAFASWLYDQEYTGANVLARQKAPTVTKRVVKILSDEEISRVLQTLATPSATNARNRAIFLTLLDIGVRASELRTLTLDRAHLDEGYLLVLGKGRKERPVKIGSTAAAAMRANLARYRPEPARPGITEVFLSEGYRVVHPIGDGAECEELLFSEPGWPLSKNALTNVFVRLGRRAGVPRLHPHRLRHTYACRYLLAHRDPLALKTMLGHTTLAMTNHYVAAVEGMQLIRSDLVSVVDALDINIGRPKRSNRRGGRPPAS